MPNQDRHRSEITADIQILDIPWLNSRLDATLMPQASAVRESQYTFDTQPLIERLIYSFTTQVADPT